MTFWAKFVPLERNRMNGEREGILGEGERDPRAILDEKEVRPFNLLWYTIICYSKGSSYWKAVFSSSFLPVQRLCATRGAMTELNLLERCR